ncbi:MAG: sigma-70 family RNA polymerase sigma factor [bacterium]|nr:sigma-70 family RNA polymerase sigma factor [bacterium]
MTDRPAGVQAPAGDTLCRLARSCAQRFLRRFGDPTTRLEFDDLVQDSAIAAWRWSGSVREPRRFAAAVRTIARRRRSRWLRSVRRREAIERAVAASEPEAREPEARESDGVVIAGICVPREWLLPRLATAIDALPPIDRCLILAFQEGFCVLEIAERYGLTAANVRVRTHRARSRVRERIEAAARLAVRLDEIDE